MSLKPEKKSDTIKANMKMQKKKKQTGIIEVLPQYIYIVSEGTKTEPNYITGLINVINERYSKYTTGDRIMVKGTGRSTKGLLNYARKQVEKDMENAEIVWLMYDKDDFPYDDFDNTQYSADDK